jgi:uncharacterized membrane protein YgdD (TMEM256/DUF423 family)
MHKGLIKIAALLGVLSVILGAFAAHGLKQILLLDRLQIFETAIRYQFYHVFAILAVGILYKEYPSALMKLAGQFFLLGILFFSGSLYLLCYVKHNQLSLNWVGAITPFGGLFFIVGWVFIFWAVLKRN